MRKPDLSKIEAKMKNGKSFSITRKQYLKMTGSDIPQDQNYTKKRSAVAKRAYENGFVIDVQPEVLFFTKIE